MALILTSFKTQFAFWKDQRLTHASSYKKKFVSFSELIWCFQSGEKREVYHYLYVSWPDFGVPKSASAMLDFREHVLRTSKAAVHNLGSSWRGPPGGPPVIVHCSAGIGRTGKYCKPKKPVYMHLSVYICANRSFHTLSSKMLVFYYWPV